MSGKKIRISDPTLRDGNHAIGHKLTKEQIAQYCVAADAAGIDIVEVGHGNGVGASSLQLGLSTCDDETALKTARENLKKSKLGIHCIPGFATIEKDLKPALDYGVDVVRVASHVSEADLTERHIGYTRKAGREAVGVLMMSHMVEPDKLLEEAKKMESYGAQSLVFMDSSGNYLPENVSERVRTLLGGLKIPVGFHAHNNLGMAIANSIAAAQAGATTLDGCARGFGAGAGNAQVEVLVAVLHRMGFETNVDLYKILDAADMAEREFVKPVPIIQSTSIVSGLAGVFSGFKRPVERVSDKYKVDPRDVFFELGRRKIIAGQEDLIIEVAQELSKSTQA